MCTRNWWERPVTGSSATRVVCFSLSSNIVAIQNLVGRGRVWRLRVNAEAAHVDDLQLLLRQHPDLRNPTTGVVVGRRFLFVADPNLQVFADNAVTPAPDGRRGHRILALPLP